MSSPSAVPGVELYRQMRLIRRFEERVVDLVNADEIAGVTHEYIGQEAVAVGVCAALRPDDVLTSTHRGHGHLLARGCEPSRMFAELMGREGGFNKGRGGSMHIADISRGIYGANGLVAGGVPFAAGASWVMKRTGTDRMAVAFFGDGALNQGVLLETFNLASLMKLPVLFVCENNGYAVTLASGSATAGKPVQRAASFAMHAEDVDGMDVEAVRGAVVSAQQDIRSGGGPAFLNCITYRFVGHHTAERFMKLGYRSEAEIEGWRARDPLKVQAKRLTDAEVGEIDREVEAELDNAVEAARQSPYPDPQTALDYMYATETRYLPTRGWSDA